MKISARTLAAARKAAADQSMSLDSWADKVLANAAATNQPANVETLLRDIANKVDQIVDRQSFGEKTNEQLAAAVREIGSSFKQATRTTGRVLGEVGTKTSSAVGEMAGKALEAIGQMSKPATEPAAEGEARGGASADTMSGTAAKPRDKKSAKARDGPRRRSPPGQKT